MLKTNLKAYIFFATCITISTSLCMERGTLPLTEQIKEVLRADTAYTKQLAKEMHNRSEKNCRRAPKTRYPVLGRSLRGEHKKYERRDVYNHIKGCMYEKPRDPKS